MLKFTVLIQDEPRNIIIPPIGEQKGGFVVFCCTLAQTILLQGVQLEYATVIKSQHYHAFSDSHAVTWYSIGILQTAMNTMCYENAD